MIYVHNNIFYNTILLKFLNSILNNMHMENNKHNKILVSYFYVHKLIKKYLLDG